VANTGMTAQRGQV